MGYDSCNQMLTKPKTVWLTARCRACGTLDHPLRHLQQSSRASRVVDDPTRYLLISMDMKTSDEIVRQNLTEWVNGGVVIEDHRYSFLGFTENHVRKGRIIFFREDENWTVDRLLSYLGDGLRDVFMSSGYGKYAARLGLSFSSTWESLNVPEDQTVLLPPWKAVDGSDHSDGCGMIRDSFAAQVCKHHDLPIDTTVFQIRRGGIKGLLVRYPDHKFDTLCCAANCRSQALVAYRQSMSKYEGGPTILELIGYSHCLGSARLNFSFILLLLTLGIKLEVFKRFLKDQLDLIGCILHDRDVAERYVKGELDAVDNGFGQDLYALLLAKHDLKEPYVRWKLQQYQRTQYEQLRKKMNLRVEDSCYVYGVVDEDGILAEDEVFISLPARTGVIVREVLVCRNPAYAAGDLRKFRAVNYETLKHHKYCIVFSRKAARSIPDTMSSGDLDGDTYFVTWDPTLLPQKMAPPQERRNVAHAAVDPSQHRRRSDRLAHGMAQAAVETFLRYKFNAVVGTMVNEWKREAQATSLLADAPYPRALVPIIESAHDMLKSGSDPEMIRKQFYALKKKTWQKETTFTSPIDVLRGLIPEANSQSITNFICDPALILRGEDEEKWRWFSEEARILLPQFNRALRDAIRLDEDASDDDTSESPRYQDRPIRHSEQCKLDYQGRYFGGGSHYDLYLQKLRASAWYCYGYSRKKVAFAWLGERYLNDIRAHWTNGGKPILYIATQLVAAAVPLSLTHQGIFLHAHLERSVCARGRLPN
ncbi:RdRP-domain-containing protein [Sparassis crispa]|uniref:RNA-dependent RNA polymerase n=1 Tax=Sparassis crispa TaxID=139825 RepID=A0A401GA41_9APHY|nr:RdRP-domain-containing protein [Sparassis crispa]GBE79056.1 RdRP-domain-containing protein [Sparassis crispa]